MNEIITKMDAARRQLNTAVQLFFSDGDMIAVHTLATASHEILWRLGKQKGVMSVIRSQQHVKPEYTKEFNDLLNKARNFFKHADRDAGDVLDFDTKAIDIWIYDAVSMYCALHDEAPYEYGAFLFWFTSKYSELLLTPDGPVQQQFQTFRDQGITTKQAIRNCIEEHYRRSGSEQ
jgi:hypothetical protein